MGNTSFDQRQSILTVGIVAALGGMVLGGVIVLALVLPSNRDRVPENQAVPPPPADEEISDEEWERSKQAAFAVPPKKWSCDEKDSFDQEMAFHRWYFDTDGIVPEVYPAVRKWLDGDDREIDRVISNEPASGAQYRIVGAKEPDRVWLTITFVGNLNWK